MKKGNSSKESKGNPQKYKGYFTITGTPIKNLDSKSKQKSQKESQKNELKLKQQ